jgi:hypothetical protein
MHAKRRVIVRRVVAMSHCRSAQIKGWAIRRMTTRRFVCLLATLGRGENNFLTLQFISVSDVLWLI